VLAEIEDHPTRFYLHHYRTLNALLDQIAVKIATFIHTSGFDALPIPASQIVDWDAQTAHLSHKMVAVRSGIGWLGRNNLLVHPEYGSSIRLATVLTNMPLLTDSPIEGDCGKCRRCIEVCPVSAIGESYKDYNREACFERLKWFAKTYNIGHYICGICVKACRGKF
ncbi:MAG: reductive dehalogenase domain-containing protein, partial [Nitrospirota bacterium]